MGRFREPGADRSITGSAVPVAAAGVPTANYDRIEAPTNVIFRRIGGRLGWRPFFISNRACSVCLWHLAAFQTQVPTGRYWVHSGQRAVRGLKGYAPNDPKRGKRPGVEDWCARIRERPSFARAINSWLTDVDCARYAAINEEPYSKIVRILGPAGEKNR